MKINLSLAIFLVALIICFVPYEISHVAIALVSVMAAFFVTRNIEPRYKRILIFFVSSVALVQMAIALRDNLWLYGMKNYLKAETFSKTVGDVLFGLKYIFIAIGDLGWAVLYALKDDNYKRLEKINPRFIAASVLIIGYVIRLIKQPKEKLESKA